MSDTEEDSARDHLSSNLRPCWHGPVVVEDMRGACCSAHGGCSPTEHQPCMWLHNVLSSEECMAILRAIDEHHAIGAYSTATGVRSQFSSLDPNLSTLLWERIRSMIPRTTHDGGTAVGLTQRVTHARYLQGQAGFPHIDFRHGDRADPTVASRISFTVYLNDDYEGGELSFISMLHDDGSITGEHSTAKPRAGSAVLFFQCLPQFAHLPHAVTAGTKSILRADVMYKFATSDSADVGGLKITQQTL